MGTICHFDTSTVGAAVTAMTGDSHARTEMVRARNVIFAAPRDDPRARRPADAAVLVFAAIVSRHRCMHRTNSDLDARVLRLFDGGLPVGSVRHDDRFLVGGLFAWVCCLVSRSSDTAGAQ